MNKPTRKPSISDGGDDVKPAKPRKPFDPSPLFGGSIGHPRRLNTKPRTLNYDALFGLKPESRT